MAAREPSGDELARLRERVAALEHAEQEWQATERELRATAARLQALAQQTERQLTEACARLERNLRFTEALLAAVPNPVFFKDAAGRYLGCNRAFEEQMGVRATDLKGKTVYELWPSDHACVYHARDLELMRQPERQVYEFRVRDAQGRDRDVIFAKDVFRDETGAVAGIVGAYMDITERKLTEAALRHEKELARNYLDIAHVMIVALDARGRVTLVNRHACTVLGRTENEVVDQDWFDTCVPARLQTQVRAAFDRLMAGDVDAVENYENLVVTATGDERLIAWHNAILRDADGRATGTLSSGEDVTDLRRTEDERLQLERQLLHAQKLESLGILAGGIAHDFNNLLTAVLGNADLALTELAPESAAHDFVKDIETAARRAAGLCQQMLAYSGKGRFVVERVNLSDAVREISHLLEVSVGKKAMLRYQFAPDLPATLADRAQVRQVLLNLITNAAEAIGDKPGLITLTTGVAEFDAAYLAEPYLDPSLPPGPYVFLEVADTGGGMTPEVRARMFDPFFTTKFTGRGLGLPAVLGIVRGHRGAIKIATAPDAGTTIRVLFPAAAAPAAATPPPPATGTTPAVPAPGGTVLVVDDEDIVRVVVTRMLQRLGYRPRTARDGYEALEAFRANREDIVAVLLDLTMPRMDGEEACRELRRVDPQVPIVIASGYSEQEVAERFATHRIAGFIQKPYRLETLAARLRAALAPQGPAVPPA